MPMPMPMPVVDIVYGAPELTISPRHYSYECKASSQERPYVSRPSRSQQLRNPQLVPKLTSDTLNLLEKKQGVADEILAKQEAERARQRDLDGRDEEDAPPSPKRRRSLSSGRTSTISSSASRDRPSPRRGLGLEFTGVAGNRMTPNGCEGRAATLKMLQRPGSAYPTHHSRLNGRRKGKKSVSTQRGGVAMTAQGRKTRDHRHLVSAA
ncbi:uncharacterized protein UV8b_07302 [Ustilaginoidea virens]|uniref:Uncharacterized protein n=1 Tax=Ustilaginoidea virens TaxID=1159556 RepID=A0A8E5MKP0_USTVR|nr:uncharacterized protein UV8b_07302 [Ustilaginoidea virens]QUC23061.1 hypothetical protein UV8b_07302 [Ustilaginoidea virens]